MAFPCPPEGHVTNRVPRAQLEDCHSTYQGNHDCDGMIANLSAEREFYFYLCRDATCLEMDGVRILSFSCRKFLKQVPLKDRNQNTGFIS